MLPRKNRNRRKRLNIIIVIRSKTTVGRVIIAQRTRSPRHPKIIILIRFIAESVRSEILRLFFLNAVAKFAFPVVYINNIIAHRDHVCDLYNNIMCVYYR